MKKAMPENSINAVYGGEIPIMGDIIRHAKYLETIRTGNDRAGVTAQGMKSNNSSTGRVSWKQKWTGSRGET